LHKKAKAWWHRLKISALGKLRLENHKLQARLDYIAIPYLKKKKKH
jgi:hypothetical protein